MFLFMGFVQSSETDWPFFLSFRSVRGYLASLCYLVDFLYHLASIAITCITFTLT